MARIMTATVAKMAGLDVTEVVDQLRPHGRRALPQSPQVSDDGRPLARCAYDSFCLPMQLPAYYREEV
jgi:hypothetical protein